MLTSKLQVVTGAAVLASLFLFVAPRSALAVPSYARQGNIPCASCHTIFPALTPYGRQFKLNGYVGNAGEVLTDKEQTGKGGEGEEMLTLGKLPPVSVMMLASWASTHRTQPGAEHNGDVLLPDEFSFFLAGQIAPKAGAFMQVTYTAADDHFSWDNTDIRAADHTTFGGKDLLYGVSLNNNPTVQDVWNSTPTWGFPFASSEVVPTPAAGALIDGALGEQVAGLSLYSFWNNLLYAEVGAYHAAPLGTPRPLSGTSTPPAADVPEHVVPYWRVALQQQLGEHYLMVGAYGLNADILPGDGIPLTGFTNRYTDVAMDLQYEKPFGSDTLLVHSTWIHENQTREADVRSGASSNLKDKLDVVRIDANYYIDHHYGTSLALFSTRGTSDALLYADSAAGSPNSRGEIVELAWLPWLNTKFALQYTAYDKFDGSATNYDGAGRSARDNNTTFVYAWLIF